MVYDAYDGIRGIGIYAPVRIFETKKHRWIEQLSLFLAPCVHTPHNVHAPLPAEA
jgi:hypothetical protein